MCFYTAVGTLNPRKRRSERLVSNYRAAAHYALEARLVEAGGAMQRATVVPHHALARSPTVSVDAHLRCDHLVELLDQRAAFRVIHAFDRLGMVAEENGLTSSLWVGAHNRMRDWRYLGLLFRRQRILAVAARARKVKIMDRAAAFDFALHSGRQQVIGGIHVSELGFSTHVRHNLRVHHGCLSGALFPGAIGVPVQRASVRMLAARIAVLVEIGKHVDFRMFLVAVVLAKYVDLHLAEIACKSDLRRRRQIDIAEQDQFIVEKGFKDLGKYRR